jgi:nitroreductase
VKDILSTRNWRYATKKFDSTKQVPEEEMEQLLEAIRLSASSYGLQPYSVYVIQSANVREELRPHSWNQPQITEASQLLVFASRTDFDESLIENYLNETSRIRNIDKENLQGYGDFMKNTLSPWTKERKAEWSARQAYIALGNGLQAAAELGLDTCPIEGFVPAEYNRILNLEENNLSACVVMAVGYRSEEDSNQHLAKVRTPKNDFITYI